MALSHFFVIIKKQNDSRPNQLLSENKMAIFVAPGKNGNFAYPSETNGVGLHFRRSEQKWQFFVPVRNRSDSVCFRHSEIRMAIFRIGRKRKELAIFIDLTAER